VQIGYLTPKEGDMNLITPIAIVVLVIFFLSAAIRILIEYERATVAERTPDSW
jgi:preprotein translocase subunit SecY